MGSTPRSSSAGQSGSSMVDTYGGTPPALGTAKELISASAGTLERAWDLHGGDSGVLSGSGTVREG